MSASAIAEAGESREAGAELTEVTKQAVQKAEGAEWQGAEGPALPTGDTLAAATPMPSAAMELVFKVANGLVGALAYEAARGSATGIAGVADGTSGGATGGLASTSRSGPAARSLAKGSTPQRCPQPIGRTPPTRTPQTIGSSPDWNPEDDDLDDDFEEDGDLHASFADLDDAANIASMGGPPPGRQAPVRGAASLRAACGERGSLRWEGAVDCAGGKGARQRRGPPAPRSGECRVPPPPPSGSLKALPPAQVHEFLQLVQEGLYADALRALRKVRRAVRGRGCSKEAFGGMRALLHHLLEAYASAGRSPEAIDLLGEMKRGTEARLVSAAAFNAVLRGLLARGSLDEARAVVRQDMPRLGVTPNETSLNLLMDTAARAGPAYLDEAWDVLEEMQSRGLRADKYTVSILTKGISERGDKRRAPRGVALVEHFLETQPEDVDEVLVNSLLDVFCRMSDMPRLEATLQKMRAYGIRGSAVTYGTIVKAYGRAGNIDKVLQAWTEMSREGLEANAVTYGCMLDACVKCGHIDRALHVFSVMKEQGLHRNTILYATLIKGFAKSKDPAAARALHREMVAEGVLCNVVVFNSLIDACVRANDLHGAAEVLQQMTAAGVQPDLITFSTLIKGYCSSGDLSKAMRLGDELAARNLECDEIVYNSLLEGCVKAGDLQLGLRLFTEMRQREVRPSSVTFSILVKLLSRAGRLDLACHLVSREMREMHGVPPTRMVWSCLVTCCVKSRDLSRAVLVLDLLDRDSSSVGGARASMYATVIEGCLAQGEVSTALTLCERACLRAPSEEGVRGLLSGDLLRRVFEAVGFRGPEVEARGVLDSIAPRISEQVRASLEDSLNRGSRRRSPRGHGRGDRDAGGSRSGGAPRSTIAEADVLGSTTSATWPGGVIAAAQQWPHPSYSQALQAAGAGSSGYTSMPWDTVAVGAWGWPQPGSEGYGPSDYNYSLEASMAHAAYYHSWWGEGSAGLHWPFPGGASSSTNAEESPVPPTSPASPRSKAGAVPETPVSFKNGLCEVATPGMASVIKANDRTPATTAGHSPFGRSPEEDETEDDNRDEAERSSIQMRLFADTNSNWKSLGTTPDTTADAATEKAGGGPNSPMRVEVPLTSLLDGPPGLC